MSRLARITVCVLACAGAACGGLFAPSYEYEEALVLSLDGAAVVDVNASVAALSVLRGAALDPSLPLDLERVRAFYEAPDVTVSDVEAYTRDGRPFVRVRVETDDLTALSRTRGLSWSLYRLRREADRVVYRQIVGFPPPSAEADATDAGWEGGEAVAFRVRAPGEVLEHNAPDGVQRGNFVVWEQPLPVRVRGGWVDLTIEIDDEPILTRALTLFGATILAAIAAFALAVWWLVRKGSRGQGAGGSAVGRT